MVQRPPFDREPPARPGGFDPRFDREENAPRLRRERFDQEQRPSRDEDPFEARSVRRQGLSRGTVLWLVLGGLLLLGAIVFGLTIGRSDPGSDRVAADDKEQASEEAAGKPEARCAAPATYDLIKRELFRQAAATRGSDQAAFDKLVAYATIRVSNPVLTQEDEGLQRTSCSGQVALDLPPGVQVVGGRRTLTANMGYNLQSAADGSGGVVTLSGAEPIVVPLATLVRAGEAAPTASVPATSDQEEAPPPPPTLQPPVPDRPEPINPAPAAPPPPPAASPVASARPSFNCARARTSGEIAVCNSPDLAALDRQMAAQYVAALRDSDPARRALLQSTRDRFLSYRDRCGTDRCIADAYRGRITEIRDILDGRWRAQ